MTARVFRSGASFVGIIVLVLAPLGLAAPFGTASADNGQALLARALRDTNTVRTLVHHDHLTVNSRTVSVTATSIGAEDEVQNREHDSESVTVKARATNGKIKTLHYTTDFIFLNNLTYYRTSLAHNQWKNHSGMTFTDPYTGEWKRGRTTVDVTGCNSKVVGVTGGLTRIHCTFTDAKTKTAGTRDLWISGGSKPYVVREDMRFHSTNGIPGTEDQQISFGSFNSSLNIQPPASGSA